MRLWDISIDCFRTKNWLLSLSLAIVCFNNNFAAKKNFFPSNKLHIHHMHKLIYATVEHDGCVFNRVEPFQEMSINMFITFTSCKKSYIEIEKWLSRCRVEKYISKQYILCNKSLWAFFWPFSSSSLTHFDHSCPFLSFFLPSLIFKYFFFSCKLVQLDGRKDAWASMGFTSSCISPKKAKREKFSRSWDGNGQKKKGKRDMETFR